MLNTQEILYSICKYYLQNDFLLIEVLHYKGHPNDATLNIYDIFKTSTNYWISTVFLNCCSPTAIVLYIGQLP
jgi:hypothetical protein